jgi:hypothetical protein
MDPLEKIFGKTAQMTVLKNLIENQNEPTYLSGIANENGLSHAMYQGLSHHWSCQGHYRKTHGQGTNFPCELPKQGCKFDNRFYKQS